MGNTFGEPMRHVDGMQLQTPDLSARFPRLARPVAATSDDAVVPTATVVAGDLPIKGVPALSRYPQSVHIDHQRCGDCTDLEACGFTPTQAGLLAMTAVRSDGMP